MTAIGKQSLVRPVMQGEKKLIMGMKEGVGEVRVKQMKEMMSRQTTDLMSMGI